jgi:hypothetical protein
MIEVLHRSAVISDCGKYRYRLTRELGGGCGNVLFVMLNPSTADAEKDDPTIKRCIGFARRWGYNALMVGNLYALRATDPRDLTYTDADHGPDWEYHMAGMAAHAHIVVAWGTRGSSPRRAYVEKFLKEYGVVKCMGRTKDGSPKHPLYLPDDTELRPYRDYSSLTVSAKP